MGRQNWFAAVGEEHRCVRERVGVFDQSSFAKYELRGKDAEEALGWICANNVARPVGKLTYTQMLNSRGGIECDLTVARLAEDHFYIVTGTGFRTHDFAWIVDHLKPGLEAKLTDITEQYGTLSVMGPKSRAVIQAVTKTDMSNAAFKFGEVLEIEIAGHKVRALRVTYVGEAMSTVYTTSFRMVFAGIFVFMVSQSLDIVLFYRIRQITGDKWLWARNKGSTIVSQGVDTYLFTFLAFYGLFDDWVLMATTNYCFKLVVAFSDTFFIYASKYITPRDLKAPETIAAS